MSFLTHPWRISWDHFCSLVFPVIQADPDCPRGPGQEKGTWTRARARSPQNRRESTVSSTRSWRKCSAEPSHRCLKDNKPSLFEATGFWGSLLCINSKPVSSSFQNTPLNFLKEDFFKKSQKKVQPSTKTWNDFQPKFSKQHEKKWPFKKCTERISHALSSYKNMNKMSYWGAFLIKKSEQDRRGIMRMEDLWHSLMYFIIPQRILAYSSHVKLQFAYKKWVPRIRVILWKT